MPAVSCSVSNHKHEFSFVESFVEFYIQKKYLDLIFICKGNFSVKAHKTIVCSVSRYLESIIQANGQEVVYINLPDVDHKDLLIFINFLYDGTTKLNVEEFIALREVVTLLDVKMPDVDVVRIENIPRTKSKLKYTDKLDNIISKYLRESNFDINSNHPLPEDVSDKYVIGNNALIHETTNENNTETYPADWDSVISEVLHDMDNGMMDSNVLNMEDESLISNLSNFEEKPTDTVQGEDLIIDTGISSAVNGPFIESYGNQKPMADNFKTEEIAESITYPVGSDCYYNQESLSGIGTTSVLVEDTISASNVQNIGVSQFEETLYCSLQPSESKQDTKTFDMYDQFEESSCERKNIESDKCDQNLNNVSGTVSQASENKLSNSRNIDMTPKRKLLSVEESKENMERIITGDKEVILETAFKNNKKPDLVVQLQLALHLGTSVNIIQKWFCSRITRDESESSVYKTDTACHATLPNTRSVCMSEKSKNNLNEFECKRCGEKLSSDIDFKLHNCKGDLAFKCSFCDTSFTSNDDYETHLKAHSETESYKSNIWKKIVPQEEVLDTQKKSHTPAEMFSCDICETRFSQKLEFQQHVKLHNRKKLHRCDECGSVFSRLVNLQNHLNHHTEGRKFECDICKFICKSHYLLEKHMKSHNAQEAECGNTFVEDTLLKRDKKVKSVIMKKNQNLFLCNTCGKKFVSPKCLKVHNCNKKQKFKCKDCNASFLSTSLRKIHAKVHTKIKPYKCNVCKKCFTQRGNLDAHKRIHTGEKPYSCKICGATFIQRSHIQQHSRMHTGEKPYECKKCGSAFTQLANLRSHIKLHLQETVFKCKVCSCNCKTVRALQKHMKTHKIFENEG